MRVNSCLQKVHQGAMVTILDSVVRSGTRLFGKTSFRQGARFPISRFRPLYSLALVLNSRNSFSRRFKARSGLSLPEWRAMEPLP